MAEKIQPMPTSSPVTTTTFDPKSGKTTDSRMMSGDWVQWFLVLVDRLVHAPHVQGSATAPPTTNTAINPTPVNLGVRPSGLYRVTYYARITQPATVSSSLTVMIGWTENGVNKLYTGAAMTGNSVTTAQANSIMVYSDGNTPIAYLTNYSANAANSMKYALDVVVEAVSA